MTGQCNLNTMAKLKSTRHRCDTQPLLSPLLSPLFPLSSLLLYSLLLSSLLSSLLSFPSPFLLLSGRLLCKYTLFTYNNILFTKKQWWTLPPQYPYWISSGLTVRAKYRALVATFTVVWVTIGKILRCCQIQHNVKCTEHWCKQRKEYLISLTSKFYSLLNTIWKVLTYDTLTYQ